MDHVPREVLQNVFALVLEADGFGINHTSSVGSTSPSRTSKFATQLKQVRRLNEVCRSWRDAVDDDAFWIAARRRRFGTSIFDLSPKASFFYLEKFIQGMHANETSNNDKENEEDDEMLYETVDLAEGGRMEQEEVVVEPVSSNTAVAIDVTDTDEGLGAWGRATRSTSNRSTVFSTTSPTTNKASSTVLDDGFIGCSAASAAYVSTSPTASSNARRNIFDLHQPQHVLRMKQIIETTRRRKERIRRSITKRFLYPLPAVSSLSSSTTPRITTPTTTTATTATTIPSMVIAQKELQLRRLIDLGVVKPILDILDDLQDEDIQNRLVLLTARLAILLGGHADLIAAIACRPYVIDRMKSEILYRIVLQRDLHALDALLVSTSITTLPDRGKYMAMIVACARGDISIVHRLVDYGIDPFTTTTITTTRRNLQQQHQNAQHYTPIGIAASEGQTEIVRYLLTLLKRGYQRTQHHAQQHPQPYDIDQRDVHGITPLMWAVHGGHIDIVQMLLHREIDGVSAKVNAVDSRGWTPLMYAIEFPSKYTVTAATVQDTDKLRIDMVEILLRGGGDVNYVSKSKRLTPLMLASYRRPSDLALLRLLLYGSTTASTIINTTIDYKSTQNITAMEYAARAETSTTTSSITNNYNRFESVRLLVSAQLASLDSTTATTVKSQALLWAVLLDNASLLDVLLKYTEGDINIDVRDEYGNTPLILACRWRCGVDVVLRLLQHGAAPTTIYNHQGRNALDEARRLSGSSRDIEELLKKYIKASF